MLKLYGENGACCVVFLHAVSTSTTLSHLPFWNYHPKISILWNACLTQKCFLAWYVKLINNPFTHIHFRCLMMSFLEEKYLYPLILCLLQVTSLSPFFLFLSSFISFFPLLNSFDFALPECTQLQFNKSQTSTDTSMETFQGVRDRPVDHVIVFQHVYKLFWILIQR